MGKHTPAPWRIGAMECGMVAIDGANGEEVTGFVSPEDGALIVVAPELLDALSGMVAMWQSVCRVHGWETEHRAEAVRAQAALAKAIGEQP